jgi:hypothetical protein
MLRPNPVTSKHHSNPTAPPAFLSEMSNPEYANRSLSLQRSADSGAPLYSLNLIDEPSANRRLIMGTSNATRDAKDWAKLALKFGLVLTAPKVWRAISDQLNDRVEDLSDRLSRGLEDVSDTATRKFGDASDRLSGASDALRGRQPWAGPVTGLLVGLGIGAALGILLAPAAGSETRDALRDKAVQTKKQVIQSASNATERIRQSVPFTGTEGD